AIWGTSSKDFYVVGNNGNIAHYDGSPSGTGWKKIESGTTLPIRDLFGARDNRSGEYEILCVADSYGSLEGSKVLSIKNNIVRELWNDGRPFGLDAIWFVPGRRYIVVGDGLWEARSPEGSWVLSSNLPMLHKTSIDANGLNDIFVCGAFWLLAHNNGVSWQTYFPFESGSFTAVVLKGNMVIAVGGADNKALVLIGRR
ncbi:MAG: glucosyl transferase, partial [Bacteroidetes bacterium]|nr:glucosyl transferase [Bacteroidota bacterium]